MANFLILCPLPITAIAASRGTGAANLLTPDPKEVWSDSAAGTAMSIDIDLGGVRGVDTIFLGAVRNSAPGATWSITGGVATATEVTLRSATTLRVIDVAGQYPNTTDAFWTGATYNVRYLRITLTQTPANPVLQAGVLLIGKAFQPTFNQEWGAGRGVIDTGSATRLPGGGFAIVEGARLGSYSWVLGDLTDAEVETLYAIAVDRGETRPLLVSEDPAATAGQAARLHYGKFVALRKYERRNPKQTRWEFSMEEWK